MSNVFKFFANFTVKKEKKKLTAYEIDENTIPFSAVFHDVIFKHEN